jgi:3',5'-cyclic AMP phosphodiesterase CpdA
MSSIKILHIGDIHFPDRDTSADLDWKDRAVSEGLVTRLAPNTYKNVADSIKHLIETDEEIAGVLLSGDLTSRGNIAGYKDCLQFLSEALSLGNQDLWKNKFLSVVPGNHDVVRSDVDPTGKDIHRKFQQATAAWNNIRPGVFHAGSVQYTDSKLPNGSVVRVIAINTCIGCGEQRYLPADIRIDLEKLLTHYASITPDERDKFKLLGEQLDTPAVLEADLKAVERAVQNLPPKSVAIVLGHHSMIPQGQVRIELYTELINGGRFRSMLTTLGSTITYCHGHIHDDPVEIVGNPGPRDGQLVLSSAPEFHHGFNVLEFYFSREGLPVGCAIHPYRTTTFRSVRPETPVRICFQNALNRGALCGKKELQILENITGRVLRFEELKTELKFEDDADLVDRLKLLDWLYLVDIRNAGKPPVYWQISRTGP